MVFFFLALIFTFAVGFASSQATVALEIAELMNSNSTLLKYPTQFTQGIVPKAIHSHNDYWRDIPLFTAVSLGIASVEADVWLINGTLYIGHEMAALTKERTLETLYILPLTKILEIMNPHNEFTTNQTRPNGIFDTSNSIPLQLLIDIKTEGTETLPFVVQALEPLRQRGYLTTFSRGILQESAVTVVGTGNTPLTGIQELDTRDIFFDAPLANFKNASTTIWDKMVAPLASVDYESVIGWSGIGNISDTQLASLNTLINDAHSFGIKTRFWNTPGWPINARNKVWEQLLNSGVDWLNADDLEAASQF